MMNVTPKTTEASPANGPAQSQALAPLPAQQAPMTLGSDAFRVGLEPSTLNDAYQLAQMIASTRICGVESAEDALIRMMTGRSLGLSTMQSLRGVYVVKGRPSLDASLMQALCLKSPLCEYFDFVSGDETQATYKTKRKGREERVFTYTIEDAVRQGLVGRGKDDDAKKDNNYEKIPKQMLRARAKSELARLEYSDLMFGMYSREELEAGLDELDGESPNDLAERIARQENDIHVEIVPNKASPVQAAPRNYAAEAEALKVRIRAAGTSRAATAEVREAIAAWDGVEPWKGQVANFYNEVREERKKAAAAATEAPPAGTAANPAPVPEGGLFAGTDPTKDPAK